MKAVFAVLGLVVVLGVVYGLAFLGIIPVKKMAAKNPMLAKMLAPLHLAPAKPKAAVVAKGGAVPSPTTPDLQALAAQKKQLADDRAQLDKDKAAFETQKQQAASSTPAAGGADGAAPGDDAPAPTTGAKLTAIYATMAPDDIAKIFAKLPDPDVIQNLLPLDEGKAGKVLAALPADRAARLSRQMMAHNPARQAAAAPGPATTIP